jgi:hypothetical protein
MKTANALPVSIFLLLALSSACFAECPTATRDIYVAAVTGESTGGIFQLEVQLRPGNGSIYTDITPRTGTATQQSEFDAVQYAFSSTGTDFSQCDVLFGVKGAFGDNSVDGPSAGAAMAVATRAALLNRTIRQDVAMTGTVSKGGAVGAVGGVIEKALAAKDAGAKYFVAPPMELYEELTLSSATGGSSFAVIGADSIQDAEGVLLSNRSATFQPKFSPHSQPIPQNLTQMALDEDTGRFTLVATKVVNGLDAKVKALFPSQVTGENAAVLQQYFTGEIANYRKLLAMGYPFSAANSAFLLSVDAEYARVGDRQIDLNGSFSDVGACVSSLRDPAKTLQNFHWAVGSDLRRIWAEKRLNETAAAREASESYVTLRDLLFANSWCGISRELASQADQVGGSAANESALSGLANEKLAGAFAALTSAQAPDSDAAWHYRAGLEANESGDFGAAIYEGVYAKSMQGAISNPPANLSAASQALISGSRTSLWGKIYYAQGAYLYEQAEEGGFSSLDAYKILSYSAELDNASSGIDRALATGGSGAGQQQPHKAGAGQAWQQGQYSDYSSVALPALTGALIGILAVAALYILRTGKGKKNGKNVAGKRRMARGTRR